MIKIEFNIFSICIFVLFLFASYCHAQKVTIDIDNMDSVDLAEITATIIQQEKESEMLRHHFDSLTFNNNYKKIIEECESNSFDYHLEK